MDHLLAIHIRPGHPDFLDLPWEAGLARWPEVCGRCVELQRGLSRHEVQFVAYGASAERYCQVQEHKWFLSEQAQEDVGLDGALEDYLARHPPCPSQEKP